MLSDFKLTTCSNVQWKQPYSLGETQSNSLGKYPWKNYCFYCKEFGN